MATGPVLPVFSYQEWESNQFLPWKEPPTPLSIKPNQKAWHKGVFEMEEANSPGRYDYNLNT